MRYKWIIVMVNFLKGVVMNRGGWDSFGYLFFVLFVSSYFIWFMILIKFFIWVLFIMGSFCKCLKVDILNVLK